MHRCCRPVQRIGIYFYMMTVVILYDVPDEDGHQGTESHIVDDYNIAGVLSGTMLVFGIV